ncbi:MAG: hypothetical protein IJ302_05235, partial [Clostridia bacterium]|nr:hypothetical protein [Clostridia bacterium]
AALPGGTFHDVACRAEHILLRIFHLDAPVTLLLQSAYPIDDITPFLPENSCECAFAVSVPRNAPVFNDYPVGTPSCAAIGIRGSCQVRRIAGGLALTLSGDGTVSVCGDTDFPAAHAALAGALGADPHTLLQRQRAADRAFLAACAENRARHPLRSVTEDDRILHAVEDVLFSVRAQQSEGGGVMAGHTYPLAYVRDQYGVLRGLLAMGAYDMARAILSCYLEIEQRCGTIQNAQGMGEARIFHIHENDNTEITAYLVLSCTDYLRETGDTAFFTRCLGMCGRAMRRALPELAGGMMPFNGDETYIAGGLLPRTVIEQGSLEATALFIAAAEALERAYDDCGLPHTDLAPVLRQSRLEAEHAFAENFSRRGGYVVNAPRREQLRVQPLYRHGVCYFGDTFGWLRRADRGCYVCPHCADRAHEVIPAPPDAEYRLTSALLTLPYVRSAVIGTPELRGIVGKCLSAYRKTGRLPSAPQGTRIVGYDWGMLLYAAAETGVEADDLLTAALDARDACGMWAEYYDISGQMPHPTPAGTRCRPWESAVNIDGILHYLRTADQISEQPFHNDHI